MAKISVKAAMLIWLGTLALALSGLGCKPKPAHAVTLRWQPSEGARHYNIYRSSQPGVRGDKVGTSTEPVFRDTEVRGGAVLYYTVTAVSGGKESGPSNEIKAVVPP